MSVPINTIAHNHKLSPFRLHFPKYPNYRVSMAQFQLMSSQLPPSPCPSSQWLLHSANNPLARLATFVPVTCLPCTYSTNTFTPHLSPLKSPRPFRLLPTILFATPRHPRPAAMVLTNIAEASVPSSSSAPPLPDEDSRFAEINGIDVHHKLFPSPRPHAPTAICMHGFGSSLFSFEICHSLQSILSLVAYDTPGFGFTSRPTRLSYYTRRFSAAIATSLANAYALDGSVVVLAHSMGASTAARFVLPDPSRISALILIAPALRPRTPGPPSNLQPLFSFLTSQMLNLSMALFVLLTPLLAVFVRLLVSSRSFWRSALNASRTPDNPVSEAIVTGYQRPAYAPDSEHSLLRFIRAAMRERSMPPEEDSLVDRLAMLGPLAPPTLIIHGEHDRVIPVDSSRRLATCLPNLKLEIMKDAGHTPHEERPEQFTEIVRRFLEEKGITRA